MKRTKRFLSILLTLCMVLGMAPKAAFAASSSTPFTDVKDSDWFSDAVQYVYDKGMMSGTGTSTFSPGVTTTRGMIVTILARMEGVDTSTGSPWYAAGCTWAVSAGISDGSDMEGQITREQLAVMLYRYAQYKGYELNAAGDISAFADSSSVSPWAEAAMGWAVGLGLINGVDKNTLAPQGSATRAQVAMILMRFCKGSTDQAGDTQAPSTSTSTGWIPTPDLEPDKTYTVTFDSNGGSYVPSQTVVEGRTAQLPFDPQKENCTFIGWYMAASGYSDHYNFASPVLSDVTVYAKWCDALDTTDTDNDGLSDPLEEAMGTDPNNADTDGDGLSDHTELNWLNYDPLSDDTDGDGVLDKDEDPDKDGLTNMEEELLGTNPIHSDSDFDGLSDGDEVNI